jgi:heat-inducible transcriptional repressor
LTDDVSAVLERTADVLSSLIDYTTIVLTPEIYQEALRVVQFISLDVNRVLIILLNGVGINSEMVLNILHDGDQEDLNRISKYMSKKLEGCPATAFNESVIDESIRALPEYESILMQVRVAIGKLKTRKDQDQKMLLKGVSKMLKLPEFQNIAYTQKVMATLEENKILLHLLKNVADKNEGRVIIGKENEIPELNDCSLVLAPYTVKEKSTGVVGILGPTRMAYSVIIPIVKRVSELINNVGNRDKEDQT